MFYQRKTSELLKGWIWVPPPLQWPSLLMLGGWQTYVLGLVPHRTDAPMKL